MNLIFISKHLYIFIATVTFINAQMFIPNPAWQNKDITIGTDERIAIAKDAIEETLSAIANATGQLKLEEGTYGTMGNFFLQLAQFDMFSNQTIYKQHLLDFFPQALAFRPGFVQGNGRGSAHSIAATQAYETYTDNRFLDWAELAWSGAESYTLSEAKLRAGRFPGKNITINGACADLTMAGGTFWVNDPKSGFVNSLATGSYLIATSMLAQATGNQSYIRRGQDSEQFYFNHLRNPRGDMLDGIDIDTCGQSDGTYPANAGLMTEGMAMLLPVLKDDDDGRTRVSQDLLELINKTVSNPQWHSADGILIADNKQQANAELIGQYVVRGLAAIYNRNNTQSSLRTYVREYLGVQYNAVLSNARGQGSNSNLYRPSWIGLPSTPKFALDSQTNALSVLLAGIALRNDSDILPDVPSGGGESGPPQTRPKVGVIVGGVLGGVAGGGIFAFFVIWLVRRKRRQRPALDTTEERSPNNAHNRMVEPFTTTVEPFTSRLEKNREGARDGRRQLSPNRAPRDWGRAGDERTTIGHSYTTDTDASSSQGPYDSESRIPTADLIMLLNRRLQGVEWRGDEQPPDYASQG
ncbi:hypothetical protein PM082_002804 [Marasmius tenuissimus]|nr:hypothetical protein PM082_002804 [Marasmius tenuissimus]